MTRSLALAAGLVLVGCARSEQRLPFKGEGGETIYYRANGECRQSLDSTFITFMRSHHYAHGEVYGLRLFTGELVPPGAKPKHDDAFEIVWMCRYHIAEWIGTDPKTGKRATWMPKR